MTDLSKDQAIYQAMLEIADTVFNETMESNKGLQNLIKQYGGFVTLSDLCKYNHEFTKNFNMAVRDTKSGSDVHQVNVDTFSCSFPGNQVFDLLKYWKGLAKIILDQVFFYEEKIENEFVGSVDVTIDSANAKLLVKHVAKDVLRPIMNYVVAEINATKQTITFMASDGRTLSVITTDKASVFAPQESTDMVFQAMFTVEDWKRICDYAKKNKQVVKFDIYRLKDCESFDTFIVHLDGVCLRSSNPDGRYPNWRSVIPKPEQLRHRFNIVPEEWKDAQEWIKNLGKTDREHVNISFYNGSNLVYFDYDDYDFSKTKTATFHLTRTSDVTMGVAYNIRNLQKVKFTGFNLEDYEHGTIVNCEEADVMLMMPMLDGNGYVRDVSERECMDEVVECAEIVEMAAA